MENKVHKIFTMQDVFEVLTEENIFNFMVDFYKTFDTLAKAKKGLTLDQIKDVNVRSFDWIDDGKHHSSFSMNGEIIGGE